MTPVCRQLSGAEVQLTRVHYPEVRRGDFSRLSDTDLETFRGILDPHRVVTDAAELHMYNTDWWHTCRGAYCIVLSWAIHTYRGDYCPVVNGVVRTRCVRVQSV